MIKRWCGVLILLIGSLVVVSCGGSSGSSSSSASSPINPAVVVEKLQINNPGVVPIIDNQPTEFYVYVTNSGTVKLTGISWALDNPDAGFRIINSDSAKDLASGQTSKILVEASSKDSSSAAHLIAKIPNQSDNQAITLSSISYSPPESVSENNRLVVSNLGVFNTSLATAEYSVYLINHGPQLINSSTIQAIPHEFSYEKGICPNPLPKNRICQINLKIKHDATAGDGGELSSISLIPSGTIFGSQTPIVDQQGNQLTLDSRIIGNLVLLQPAHFIVDALNKHVSPGVGYIINNGTKPIIIKDIKIDNSGISVQNNCSSAIQPGANCNYSLNTTIDKINNPGNALVTVDYNDSKSDLEDKVVANWTYIANSTPIAAKLEFVENEITLDNNVKTATFSIVNSGNVTISNLSVPEVNVPNYRGSFSLNVQNCPNTLLPGGECTYQLSYSTVYPEVLSGFVGNVSAYYTSVDGQVVKYDMADTLALNGVFNEDKVLVFDTNEISHTSTWAQDLSESSNIVILNQSNKSIHGLTFTKSQPWISLNGCNGELKSYESCVLKVTTLATKPDLNPTSGVGSFNVLYSLGGRAASQAVAVNYHVAAKPITTPKIGVMPTGTIVVNMLTESTYSVNLSIKNLTTSTNGGTDLIKVKLDSLTPPSTSGISFTTSNLSCPTSDGYVILNSNEVCNYEVLIRSSAKPVGVTNIQAVIKYDYSVYSDISETPDWGTATYEQNYQIAVDPRRGAQLNIVSESSHNSFAAMKVGENYTISYKITNVGTRPVEGKPQIGKDNLPDKLSADLSSCRDLAPGASCNITLSYTPNAEIINKNINKIYVYYVDSGVMWGMPFPSGAINAVSGRNPEISSNIKLNGCGVGDGSSSNSTCYLNSGTQSNNFSLVVTLTNIGDLTAQEFHFIPADFNDSWILSSNNCGSESSPIKLDKNANCSLIYTMKNGGSSEGEYSLDAIAKVGVISYKIGSNPNGVLVNLVPGNPVYIDVTDPALGISINNPGSARLESDVNIDFIVSNWYQATNPSANITMFSQDKLPTSGFNYSGGNNCVWNIESGTTGGVCSKVLTTHAPVIVANNDYSIALTSTWSGTIANEVKALLSVKAPDFTVVSSGGSHSCGLTKSGLAYCWGWNGYGQLGNGSDKDKNVPTLVSGSEIFSSISAGGFHSCGVVGIKPNTKIMCWGNNVHGQLGNKSNVNSNVPVNVANSNGYISVSSGENHSCSIDSSGLAHCWGNNDHGQLGGASKAPNSNVPIQVGNVIGFTSVSASFRYHTCGVTNDSHVYCWGNNGSGQLGNGGNANSDIPVIVNNGQAFTSITTGANYSCGINAQSGFCWGVNDVAQLGNGTTNNSKIPTPVINGNNLISIASGGFSSCGIDNLGTAYCWGGGQKDAKVFSNEIKFTHISPGWSHSCGTDNLGSVYCWGYNAYGQLGTGNNTSSATPQKIN